MTKKISCLSRLSTFLFLVLVMLYLMINTGLHSDDYNAINHSINGNYLPLTPENLGWMMVLLPTYLSYWLAYLFFEFDLPLGYDLIKCFSHLASVLLCCHFFKIFLPPKRAIAASIFFVLLPLHDAANYWFMVVPYIFWPSVIMFSFYLLSVNRFGLGFASGLLGAFSGYFSPPYTFGLGVIWFIQKEYRKGFIFITPGILYLAYYFFIKINFSFAEKRINSHLNISDFIKALILQIIGTVDSFVGPSALIKIYYANLSIQPISFLITLFILIYALFYLHYKKVRNEPIRIPNLKLLLIGTIAVLLLSLVMFALTGLYIPSPFNLGNRSLVYGSFLVAVLISLFHFNWKTLLFAWFIFVLPVFGLSDHWKGWNQNQLRMLQNIQANENLKAIKKSDLLVVTGHTYSKLGPFSYIELFASPWVVSSIFKDFSAVAVTQTTSIGGNKITDEKFGASYLLNQYDKIYIYDSEVDSLVSGTREDIVTLIENRPMEIRHWVQLAKGTFIESIILFLSPRLKYIFAR